ncbi:hypothetical protein OIO90_001586 [Microbotryomycetes sp. JL221]|nr:hypothetical protein OIO90_001586 [Microbotryomycetes sp. JL221]
MDKQSLLVSVIESGPRGRNQSTKWLLGRAFAAGALTALFVCQAYDHVQWPLVRSRAGRAPRSPTLFPDTPLNTSINWFDCPDSNETQCAFVTMPLDHLNATDSRTVSLAVRKLPANVPPNMRKGTIFVNPGGPGGSGTEFIASTGTHLSGIVQGQKPKRTTCLSFELSRILRSGYFDIISWDPRGVNLTTPGISCFRDEATATLFQRDEQSIGLLYEASGSNQSQLAWARKLDAYNIALDETCVLRGNNEILEHQSTATTARDLKSLAYLLSPHDPVNYWGFSYGTALGSTFAAMYPELVGRFVLDGVMDVVKYTTNLWSSGESAMDHTNRVDHSCAGAGPHRCAFAKSNSTTSSLHSRLDQLRQTLRVKPLTVVTSSGTSIVTTSDIQHTIFRNLYNPKNWPNLAKTLFEAERGNGTLMYLGLNAHVDIVPHNQTGNLFQRPMEKTGTGLTCTAIMCSDTDPVALRDHSLETLIRYIGEMGRLSISGEAWSLWIARCRRWTHKAHDVYQGPWSRQQGLRQTKNKILFVSNSADPVTPLSAAERMAEQVFTRDSATLLIQNGFGHCSLAQPSLCTAKAIRRYFVDGYVPEWRTTCESDPGYLFPDPEQRTVLFDALVSGEDRALGRALDALADYRANIGHNLL